jgi:hypothetical protein
MFKSSLFISICLVLFVCDISGTGQFGVVFGASTNSLALPAVPARQRDSRQPAADEAVAAASQDIKTRLNAFLAVVNQGKAPETADIDPIAETIRQDMQYLPKMDAVGQSNLQLLNAWMNYFAGDLKRAKLAANAAYRAEPLNKDAQTTYILFCIANNDTKNAKNAIAAIRKSAARAAPSSSRREQLNLPSSAGGESRAVLDFDANSVDIELLDKNIGAFEAACLNGTSFSFKGGKTLMMLLWAIAAPDENGSSAEVSPQRSMSLDLPSMPSAPAQSAQTISSTEDFASLFANEFQNSKVAFLGLNLDAAGQSGDVMASLMKNAWPWPQAMAQDSRNASLAFLASLGTSKPALVIVGPDGAIKYAGTFSGLVLRIMAAAAQGGAEITIPQTAQKEELNAGEPETPEAAAKPPKQENATVASTPAAAPAQAQAPQPKKAPKSDEERLNPAATDLYQFAVSQKRMAHITGYGTMVNACRQILREYPDAPEAEKARELLREIPENKRQQFHITNEEMGL